MENLSSQNNKFVCTDCFKLKKCRESSVSWAFFFIALVATVAVRAVNALLDFNLVWAKIFWYVGVVGFFLFFLYKFKHYSVLHRELLRTRLTDKLLKRETLSDHDYDVLGTILCTLSSKKDKINYFFIFVTSGIALILAVYADFFR